MEAVMTTAAPSTTVKITPLQLEVAHHLLKPLGDVVSLEELQHRFLGEDGRTDHRLVDSIWGLME
jgi:DNA-binding response OmpR family regulator